jgi:alpha-2-macroglobulin
MPLEIEFNNPLDADSFDDRQIAITPAIPDVKLIASGRTVSVVGTTAARTRYSVVVSHGVVDEFGQALGKDAPLAWSVGDAAPTLFGPDGLVVLDPSATRPTLDVFSASYNRLSVQLYAVTPADFEAYRTALRNRWNHDHPPQLPGRKVFDQRVAIGGSPNQLAETHVDLRPALGPGGLGHVLAVVEPSPWPARNGPPPRMISWVQSTRLAIDAHVDSDHLIAHASQLDTGKSAAGVALQLQPYGIAGTTDDRGLATLVLADGQRKGAHYLVARKGDDVAFVTQDEGYWSESGDWFHQPRGKQLAWYVTDDRKLYKPGEEVSLKGWLRTIDQARGGDVGGLAGAVTGVSYKVMDAQGNQIAAGTAPVDPAGGFDTRFTLPKTPNLGQAEVAFEAQGSLRGSYGHAIEIEEFRRPEFEVAAQPGQGPFLVGGGGDVTVSAKYFAGGPLAGAPVAWTVSAAQTGFTPPNRDDYVFGIWQPWWGPIELDEAGAIRTATPPRTWTLAATTDAIGAHTLHMDFLSARPAVPMSVTATAQVTDVNRQVITASSAMIVHPSSLYVGVKTRRPFVDRGTPFEVELIGVDQGGKAAPGAKIDVAVVRRDWEFKHGKLAIKEVDPQSCAVAAGKAPSPCSFQTRDGGEYQLTATIVDAQGRPNQTRLVFWVSGGARPPARDVAQERVQLIPDKKEYTPGNTAELLVQAPFYPAEGVVSWRRSGIVKAEKITLDGPTQVITVPISDAMVPNLVVQVDLVGLAVRTDDAGVPDPKLPRRPAYAVGTIDLPIPPRQRTLSVEVAPAAARLSPGEKTSIAVAIRDAAGQPVADAEAAVIVVDEAILSLTGTQFDSPLGAFYPPRGSDTRDAYSQAYIKLARPDVAELQRGAPMAVTAERRGAIGFAPGAPAPEPAPPMAQAKSNAAKVEKEVDVPAQAAQAPAIAIRTHFNPLAAFAPAVHTDAAGRATVELTLPDNLTRYRVVAIAVAGDRQFGKGESAVTARLPLMVRPSPPRFLNFGDAFQLPVVVQNQTDTQMTVRVAVRASNAALTAGAGREVTVPPNDRVEVRFPAAAELAGTARFQVVGEAGRGPAAASDAAELALPVWTPATTEAFATYGVIDDQTPGGAVAQPVALPGKVVTQFGGLEVTTASTHLAALTDAMLYLVHYPFECSEQRSSRILAIAALQDVLAAFHTRDMPSAAAIQDSVRVDVEHLSQLQNSDGGFAFWDRGYPSVPYLSVYVASALGLARQKGFAVPAAILDHARQYLRDIERHYPDFYPKDVRWAISAFALSTRKQLGDLDLAKGKQLIAEAGGVDKLPLEADGWLLGLFAQSPAAADERKAIVRHALNRVSETAGAASFTTSYGDGNYLLLASDRRVDAVMLDALIQDDKDLDLIPKLVTGLLGHRKAGRWLNTQENTFALVALDRYFQTYEQATPDFVARVWLGSDYAGDHAFRGRSTDNHQIAIAMKDVASHDRAALTIQRAGTGRLYYRIGMTYAPASLQLLPADHGFVVERRYEAVDDPRDVTRAADGTWHIKAGARVRVRLSMVNESRRYHVALVDPLPAGLEILNPALATTGPIPEDPKQASQRGPYWWWYGPWYEHQNLRDERAEAFAPLLWEGVHSYDYVARATTPGSFVVPPTRAEEMYMPETFGRGASDRVAIE